MEREDTTDHYAVWLERYGNDYDTDAERVSASR